MRKIGKVSVGGLILAIAVVIVVLYAWPEESVAAEVDNNLAAMMAGIDKDDSATGLSSNPYDYIMDNPNFDAIVALGYDALPALEQALRATEADGLREYIICIAIEQISSCDLKQIADSEWDRAQVFRQKWDDYLKEMPARVLQIMEGELSAESKVREITALGAPAIPYAVDYADVLDEEVGAEAARAFSAVLAEGKSADTVGELTAANADVIKQLRAYVESR